MFNDTQHRATFATAELLVKLTIIKRQFTSASGPLNFCTKIFSNIVATLLMVRRSVSSLLLNPFSVLADTTQWGTELHVQLC